jgi:hypothetical protein
VRRRRLADARDVVRAVSEPVPALACVAGSCSAGCEAQGKARGSRSARGHRRGEGWHGVNTSEPLLMPRNHHIPGRVAVRGDRGFAAEMRQAAAGEITRSCGHRRPRGTEGTLNQPGLTRAEHGNPVRVRAAGRRRGRPIVRGAEAPGGTGCPRSECRPPKGSRKTRQGTRLLRWAVSHNWPDTGRVPGRESALTWAGEPLKTNGR